MLQKGFEQASLGGRAASIERFPDLFAEKVRPDFDDTYYQKFDKRLKLYRDLPEPLPGLLEGVLRAVMKADGPVARDTLHEALAASAFRPTPSARCNLRCTMLIMGSAFLPPP